MPGVDESPGQIRPDPEPSPDLPATKRSKVCPLNDGSHKQYPTLDDYLSHLVHLGIVKDLDDLVHNYGHLIGEIFFNWVQTGQLACLFAVKLAKKPRQNRWLPIVQLDPLKDASGLAALLNTQLDAASADSGEENRSFRAEDDQSIADRRWQSYCAAGDRHESRKRLRI